MEDLKKDKEMLFAPNQWPLRPFLPLRKNGSGLMDEGNLGILIEGEGLRVLVTNLFFLPASKEDREKILSIAYENAEALLQVWHVD